MATRGRLLWAAVFSTCAAVAAADCGAGCGGSLAGTPADECVAEELGLVREWVVQLPFDSAAFVLDHVVIGDGLVVGQSGDGGVHAVQAAPLPKPPAPKAAPAKAGEPKAAAPKPVAAKTAAAKPGAPKTAAAKPGALLWSRRLGPPGSLATPPGVGPHLVTTTRDMEVFAIDRTSGEVVWQRPLPAAPRSGAVEIGDWVYVPLVGGIIRRLTFNPLQPTAETFKPASAAERTHGAAAVLPSEKSLRPRTFSAGGILEHPVHPLGDGIFWTTTDGTIFSLQPTPLDWDRFAFPFHAPILDVPTARGSALYVASRGADLARVDFLKSGGRNLKTVWHVVLDAVPDAGPLVGGDTVVVSLGEAGIAAFSASSGAALWRSAVTGRVLAVAGDRAWVLDRTGRLAGIDLATGLRRERICLAGFTVPVVNVESERLLLASRDGVVVSLAARRPTPPPAREAKPPARPAQPAKQPPAAADETT